VNAFNGWGGNLSDESELDAGVERVGVETQLLYRG
jgi:hypothetical protein